jgi:hypothetical protein
MVVKMLVGGLGNWMNMSVRGREKCGTVLFYFPALSPQFKIISMVPPQVPTQPITASKWVQWNSERLGI